VYSNATIGGPRRRPEYWEDPEPHRAAKRQRIEEKTLGKLERHAVYEPVIQEWERYMGIHGPVKQGEWGLTAEQLKSARRLKWEMYHNPELYEQNGASVREWLPNDPIGQMSVLDVYSRWLHTAQADMLMAAENSHRANHEEEYLRPNRYDTNVAMLRYMRTRGDFPYWFSRASGLMPLSHWTEDEANEMARHSIHREQDHGWLETWDNEGKVTEPKRRLNAAVDRNNKKYGL
jgi:hypothetical protein